MYAVLEVFSCALCIWENIFFHLICAITVVPAQRPLSSNTNDYLSHYYNLFFLQLLDARLLATYTYRHIIVLIKLIISCSTVIDEGTCIVKFSSLLHFDYYHEINT